MAACPSQGSIGVILPGYGADGLGTSGLAPYSVDPGCILGASDEMPRPPLSLSA